MSHDIVNLRHPHYLRNSRNWELWRDTFEGGEYYRDRYLQKFNDRETDSDFTVRKKMTPIPTFAKSAILDIRNSIFQRLVGVTRNGGSKLYQEASAGVGGGVDGEGTAMDAFIGKDVLTELLVMGKVGVYIDAAPPTGETLADISFPPYLTYYRLEDILSYSYAPRGKGGEFEAVLLRDWNVKVETSFGGVTLPSGTRTQFRLVWKDDLGQVWYKLFDESGNVILQDESEDGAVLTDLPRVPFVLMDIGESLLTDVSSYQQALLNLTSNDVYYAIKSNSPFLTIQRDNLGEGDHLKKAESAGDGHTETTGAGKGRYYGRGEERPGFIAPPSSTLEVSMQLQSRLEDSIRTLVNLSVANKAGSRTESAESKKIGQGGLEAGLSFIGLELEDGEKKIATIWAEYEDTRNPNPAIVKYPDRYILKSDLERLEEAGEQLKLVEKLPGQKVKRIVSKQIISVLLNGKFPLSVIEELNREIDTIDYILSDPSTVLAAHKAGLVGDETSSEALGFNPNEVGKAREDRAFRIEQTLKAQTPKEEGLSNPASRGAPELDANPNSGADEKDDTEGDTEEKEDDE